MPNFRYVGVTTKKLYSFNVNQMPAGASTVTLNGEVCVPANNDGSLARGVAGPPPANDPYSPGSVPSTWEQQ